jgi:hypothetical protein
MNLKNQPGRNFNPNPDKLTRRLEELRRSLSNKAPSFLTAATGALWSPSSSLESEKAGEFRLDLWGRTFRLTCPAWEIEKIESGEPASPADQALLLYYFNLADGTPLLGEWISFSDLPDGRFYNQAFQGYTGRELALVFQNNADDLAAAAGRLGGQRFPLGDLAYRFLALPRLPLLVAYWLGDDDFPASAQVLFDASAAHYLTTDACAVLGSSITRRLIAQKSGG